MTETPNPTGPGPSPNPIVEEPQQQPPHVPELPPMRDTPPQKEQGRS